MKALKGVALNTIYQIFGRFSLSFFSFLTSIVITNNLGAEIWGRYSIVVNYIAMFYLLTDLGISTYLAKDFAVLNDKREIKRIFSKLLILKIGSAGVLILLAYLLTYIINYDDEVRNSIYYGLPLIFAFSIFNTTSLLFQSVTGYFKYFITIFVWTLCSYFGIWMYVNAYSGSDVKVIVLINAAFAVFSAILSLYLLRNFIKFSKSSCDIGYFRDILQKSAFVGLTLFVNTLMFSSDKIVLSVLSTPESVGVYSLAYKLFEIFLIFPSLLMNTLYPILVRVKLKSAESYKKHVVAVMLLNFFSWVVLATISSVVVKYAIPHVWGEEFTPVWRPFFVLIMTSLPFYLTAPLSWLAILENKMKHMFVIYSMGFVVNLLLNLIYIPTYDYMAAALITGLTEFIILVMLVILMIRKVAPNK